ncbi:diguanylate cyclase/phosphodiesterase [Arcobacter nitrofigilis DSM 7299]|uniref:Diguanylate cyclase/phosphodiesterase n=1 Tax=Arcobacter nitrofigilis (strain ATCC 33309 / DSM 7299 / CCUG 15893 / LMG 7604 / NCTC 12251 / CI) TaxID=572480 RepID=D5V7T5_ARCNC|nr:bifunctional diguanylate cyclase/phosphodiesterase [Arcobacter nitrofigilis]ADG94705.1 diguanylate cyclase/phosphodiesterase [Arcobacter nitrofigilis DSM 7299]
MIKTLKNYFRISILAISLLLFLIFYFFSSTIHTNLTIQENEKISQSLSKQIFNSMYQVMRKGWTREEISEFMSNIKSSFKESSYDIAVYRSKKVEDLFGKINQGEITKNLQYVFDTKKEFNLSKDNKIRNITPILAKKECLACHTNSNVGDVLGAVDIQYDFNYLIDQTKHQYFLLSLIILPFMILCAFLISGNLLKKINLSIRGFKDKIENINSVKDFKTLDLSAPKKSFVEFNHIMNGLTDLSNKLRNIAVDKDILEFEVKLLDKMIITSDVIRDWKEYIKDLLHEINIVLPVHCLITIFKANDEFYEIEVFWLGKPNEKVIKHIENVARQMIKSHHKLDILDCSINHNFTNENYSLVTLDIKDIEHEAKSILLDAPKIGGIVGLGIQSNLEKDSIHSIVIDSILTTLLNLVGSIKAINKYTENLEFYATRDPLTSLFTQRVFRDLMEYEIKRAARHNYTFGLLVIDCDNFKPINDAHGHTFGDEFLKALGNILADSKRSEDILSRYGGDEFTLILPECNKEEAFSVAQRILNNVSDLELISPDGTKCSMTVSIGMAMYPEHSTIQIELFNIADAMMYEAKTMGKNSIKYPTEYDLEEIHKEAEDKSMLVLNAIKNENIIPHFQPIVNLKTNKCEINELLMRIEIDGEYLPAAKFIETAEALGIVHKMDYMVIEKAFAKINETNYQGLLFINLSPKALIISEFINKIVVLAHNYNINRDNIVFEITERETVKSFSLLERFVQNLKLQGFSFAIDDFGSGFSSFHYIKKFPIDYIKIDGDFIINITKDKKDVAFVKSIVALAKELKVKTIAEFVENEEILEFLKNIDIDYVQGYHIGKPNKEIRM